MGINILPQSYSEEKEMAGRIVLITKDGRVIRNDSVSSRKMHTWIFNTGAKKLKNMDRVFGAYFEGSRAFFEFYERCPYCNLNFKK